jgi:methyl-accepting chemotaxis protein
MTVGRKIATGFGTVLLLLVASAMLSFSGVGGMVKDASEVIDGNKLDGELAQREVDHLNWVNKVNALINDDQVHTLNVETDDHQCGFGQWLYGEGRKRAESLVPSLAPLLKEIEEPHRLLHESAIAIGQAYRPADTALPGFLAAKEADHLKWADQVDQLFLNNLPKLTVETDDRQCSLGQWLYGDGAKKAVEMNPEFGPLLEALKEPHHRLHASAMDIQKAYTPIHPGLIDMLMVRLDDHRRWVQKVSQAVIAGAARLDVEMDPTQCAFGKFLVSTEAKAYMEGFPELKAALEAAVEPHRQLHESAAIIQKALAAGDRGAATNIYETQTLPALGRVADSFSRGIEAERALMARQEQAMKIYHGATQPALVETRVALGKVQALAADSLAGLKQACSIYAAQTMPALAGVQSNLKTIREEARRNIMTDAVMLEQAHGTKRNVGVVGTVALVVGVLMALFIARGITRALRSSSAAMDEAATQVASASGQVASSSQELAEGASENAASLEETSSSLEEMATMARQSSDNAVQANGLMQETRGVVTRASGAMKQMTTSMNDISNAGQAIGKIIKTIDEIAFQTNLLALNAAVEAARAGEAGQGFAVVAGEVRNLAQRAAEAAKNTSELIENTIGKIGQGAGLAKEVDAAFGEVAVNSGKVAELIGEIAATSREQAHGIEQISQAMSQMDTIIQKNAANAEESASASEELNAQAYSMKGTVEELLRMVGGQANGHSRPALGLRANGNGRRPPMITAARPARAKQPGPVPRQVTHEDVIPLDDDFNDY